MFEYLNNLFLKYEDFLIYVGEKYGYFWSLMVIVGVSILITVIPAHILIFLF